MDTPPPSAIGPPGIAECDPPPTDQQPRLLSVAEASRRLCVGRSRLYQLLDAGALDATETEPLRTLESVERRLQAPPPAGAQLAALSAWAILALASGNAPFLRHLAGLLSDPDRSRARSRLRQRGLLALLPRVRGRATARGFVVRAELLVRLLGDPRVVLGGGSAARALDWELPDGTWPVEAYVAESQLVALVEHYALERAADRAADVLLRSAQEPWPFPPHLRVVPEVVAALDLAEAADARVVALGTARLAEFSQNAVADWRQRPPRRLPVRLGMPTGTTAHPHGRRPDTTDLVWDDRAEQDANQLVALLFVAATPLRRADIAETLRISQGRLARACSVLQSDPLRGLRLEEAGDLLGLVSAPDCSAVIQRYLGQPTPEPLSRAALDTLAIVAYEQPITRADIRLLRGVDSDAVVETLRARGLLAEDPRFGGRGRPGFLITTLAFLRYFGLSSLSNLPPRGSPTTS